MWMRAAAPFAFASSLCLYTLRMSLRKCDSEGSAHCCPLKYLHRAKRKLYKLESGMHAELAKHTCACHTLPSRPLTDDQT